jgi:putative nucleotidyltransferase with HDIG domain
MVYKIDKIIIDKYLSTNQKKILNHVFSLKDPDTEQPDIILQEETQSVHEPEVTPEFINKFESKFENEMESRQVSFPVRFILNEKDFILFNEQTVNNSERQIKAFCFDSLLHKSVEIHFYRSSLSENENFTIQENTVILNQNIKMHDVLQVAGILSSIEGISRKKDSQIYVSNNFNDLPFSARRYYIENIILSKKPTLGFFFLDEMDCLKEVMPEVAAGKNLSQNKFHKYDIYEHLIRSCEAMEIPDLVMRFSALLHDIGKVPTRRVKENGEATFYNHEMVSAYMLVNIMKRFGIPKPTGLKVKYYVRNHMFHYTDEWSDKAVRRFLRKVSRADLANLILLRRSDRIGSGKTNPFPKKLQSLIDHIDDVIMRDLEMKVTDLEINGHELMSLGIIEGPIMGRILNQLLTEVKNEVTRNNVDELLLRARDIILNLQTEIKEPLKT